MSYGLTDEMLIGMDAVFRQHPEVSRMVLFGSRALGTHRPGSDIDLAVEGNGLRLKHILRLYAALEELDSLYKFDLLNRQRLTNEALQEHIRRVGICIYERKKETV